MKLELELNAEINKDELYEILDVICGDCDVESYLVCDTSVSKIDVLAVIAKEVLKRAKLKMN